MKAVRPVVLCIGLSVALAPCLRAQTADLSLTVLPGVSVPLGPALPDGLPFYGIGGGGGIRGELSPGGLRWLFGRAFLEYEWLPLSGSDQALSLVSAGGALGAAYSPSPRIALRASAGGGLYVAVSGLGTIRNPFLEGGAELLFRLMPALSAGLGAKYKYMMAPGQTLYQGLSFQLGVTYDLAGSRKGTELRLAPDLETVFPLFYSLYDSAPLGTAVLANEESLPLEKIKVTFFARQYMDSPRLCAEIASLPAGSVVDIPVFALFNDAIFRVTEGTKAAGELTVDYYYLGRLTRKTVSVTMQVQNRNAMTWDDDRKAAAFVTAKDPLVLGFAKSIASMVRAGGGTGAVSSEFRTALAVYQALALYGVGYAVDPKTPFSSLSETDTEVDFIQFPGQTLAYRAGDCDDLTVLYAALLESVGIETALITTPGHIFVAFNCGLSPDSAARAFSDDGDTILKDGKAWIPVEVTLIKDGFVRSWSAGAMEWRDASARGQEAIYPVREAWSAYEPVGFSEGLSLLAFPSPEKIADAYRLELARFSQTQIRGRAAELQAQIRAGREADKAANRLGILYAQYGLLAEARAQFLFAINKTGLQQAMVNMGNVEYMDGRMAEAAVYYNKALAASPSDVAALVGLARSQQAGGDPSGFAATLARLQSVSAATAAKYFPGGASASRASDAEERNVDLWNE